MSDVFGVRIAGVTLEGMSRSCAARLKGFAATVRGLVTEAPVKHTEEIGSRIGGKTQWLHVACMVMLTFYRTCAKRGSLLASIAGIVVHDFWKPYHKMTGVLHALCNAGRIAVYRRQAGCVAGTGLIVQCNVKRGRVVPRPRTRVYR